MLPELRGENDPTERKAMMPMMKKCMCRGESPFEADYPAVLTPPVCPRLASCSSLNYASSGRVDRCHILRSTLPRSLSQSPP